MAALQSNNNTQDAFLDDPEDVAKELATTASQRAGAMEEAHHEQTETRMDRWWRRPKNGHTFPLLRYSSGKSSGQPGSRLPSGTLLCSNRKNKGILPRLHRRQ
ncbi:MAG: hypothetical protein AB2556_24560 [Candidatus Thiodiazotropha sp.]